MSSFQEITVEIVIGKDRTAYRGDTKGFLADTEFIEALLEWGKTLAN